LWLGDFCIFHIYGCFSLLLLSCGVFVGKGGVFSQLATFSNYPIQLDQWRCVWYLAVGKACSIVRSQLTVGTIGMLTSSKIVLGRRTCEYHWTLDTPVMGEGAICHQHVLSITRSCMALLNIRLVSRLSHLARSIIQSPLSSSLNPISTQGIKPSVRL
jgi:hypothetical protein